LQYARVGFARSAWIVIEKRGVTGALEPLRLGSGQERQALYHLVRKAPCVFVVTSPEKDEEVFLAEQRLVKNGLPFSGRALRQLRNEIAVDRARPEATNEIVGDAFAELRGGTLGRFVEPRYGGVEIRTREPDHALGDREADVTFPIRIGDGDLVVDLV